MQPPLEANGAHLISDEEVQRFRLDKVTPHNAPITLAGYDPAVRALEGLGRRREPVKPERCCRTAAAGAAESFVGARRIWPAWRAVRARALVSERLLPCGFEVREDGKVRGVTAAVMLDEARLRAGDLRAGLSRRGVHPGVLGFCRAELLQQNYVHAVLEAAKSMAGKLRARAGVTGDGSSLDDKTCALASGPADRRSSQTARRSASLVLIAFNSLATCSAGAGIRPHIRPRSDGLSRIHAPGMLTLVSTLHRRIAAAAVR